MAPARSMRLGLQQRSAVYAQLAAMERAGVPPAQAFALLQLPTGARAAQARLCAELRAGMNIALAVQRAGLCDAFESALLSAAVRGGSPEGVYRQLSERLAAAARRQAALRARLLLPAFLLLLMGLIAPLPGLVSGQFGVGEYLWIALRPLLLIAALLLLFSVLTSRFATLAPSALRAAVEHLLLALPVLGPALIRRDSLRYFENLALLLQAGVDMFQAQPAALATLRWELLRADHQQLEVAMQQGLPLSQALDLLRYRPSNRLIAMISSGEASGTLPSSLLHHCRQEAAEIEQFDQQVAIWVPRLLYGLIIALAAWGLVGGGGTMPVTARTSRPEFSEFANGAT